MTAAQGPTVSEAEVEASALAISYHEPTCHVGRGYICPTSCRCRLVAATALTAAAKVRAENTTAPEGWKLVPVQMDERMRFAFFDGKKRTEQQRWEQVLAAAPSPALNRDALLDEVVKAATECLPTLEVCNGTRGWNIEASRVAGNLRTALQAVAKSGEAK